jgi:hypothetical protein
MIGRTQSNIPGVGRGAQSLNDIRFTRAFEESEFEGAFRCIYQSYRKRGLAPRRHHEMRLTRHHLLPSTRVFVARAGQQVVGTLSLVEDGQLGVPMRAVFDAQVEELARRDPRIAEATCLAVGDSLQNGPEIVHRLMGLLAQAASRRGITRVLIAVHPRHVAFYARSAGFRPFTSALPYPSVGGRLAVALQLDLAMLRSNFPEVHRRYFGLTFSESALSPRPVPPEQLQRIAAHWRSMHEDANENEFDGLTSPAAQGKGIVAA